MCQVYFIQHFMHQKPVRENFKSLLVCEVSGKSWGFHKMKEILWVMYISGGKSLLVLVHTFTDLVWVSVVLFVRICCLFGLHKSILQISVFGKVEQERRKFTNLWVQRFLDELFIYNGWSMLFGWLYFIYLFCRKRIIRN